jgi:hypothetical protein
MDYNKTMELPFMIYKTIIKNACYAGMSRPIKFCKNWSTRILQQM